MNSQPENTFVVYIDLETVSADYAKAPGRYQFEKVEQIF